MSSASKNLQCENLTVTEGAQAGLVLTCVSAQGKVAWAAGGGGGGGDQQGFRAKDGATVITDNAAASVGGDVTGNLMGDNACAGGPDSVALGPGGIAIGWGAETRQPSAGGIAIGTDAKNLYAAAYVYGSVVIGQSATVADMPGAVSIGYLSTVSGTGYAGTSVGAESDSGSHAVAVGSKAKAPGVSSVAVGDAAQADADESVAIGLTADTNGMPGAVAIGSGISALEANSFNATHRALALAASPTVTGNAAVFDGNELLATPLTMNTEGDISNVVTINGAAYPPANVADGYEVTLTVQGDIHTDSANIANATGPSSYAVGWALASGTSSLAIGQIAAGLAQATGLRSIAIGGGATASGTDSVAVGVNDGGGPTAVSDGSIAIGTQSSAGSVGLPAGHRAGVALGAAAVMAGGGVSIGFGAGSDYTGAVENVLVGPLASTSASVLVGGGNVLVGLSANSGDTTADSVAIGRSATTRTDGAVVIGHSASSTITSTVGGVAVGSLATVAADSGVSLGPGATVQAGHANAVSIGNGITSAAAGSLNVQHLTTTLGQSPLQAGTIAAFNSDELFATPVTISTAGDISNVVTINGTTYPPVFSTGNGYEVSDTVQGDINTDATGTATASGVPRSVALGFAVASGASSLAIGTSGTATASGIGSIAIGGDTTAGGDDTVVVGASATAASSQAVAVGSAAGSLQSGVAVGYNTSAAVQAVAVGFSSGIAGSATNSVCIGASTFVTGESGVVIGAGASSNYTGVIPNTIVGAGSTDGGSSASGGGNVVVGYLTQTDTGVADSVVIGHLSSATASQSVAIGKSAAATVGDGVAIGTSSAANTKCVAVGFSSSAKDPDSIAIGNNPSANGTGTIAIGKDTVAELGNAIAIGTDSNAQGDGSVAIGSPAFLGTLCESTGGFSVAIGGATLASGLYGVAIGTGTQISQTAAVGVSGVAIGRKAVAFGDKTVAIGQDLNTNGTRAVTLGGNSASVTHDYDDSFMVIENTHIVLQATAAPSAGTTRGVIRGGSGTDTMSVLQSVGASAGVTSVTCGGTVTVLSAASLYAEAVLNLTTTTATPGGFQVPTGANLGAAYPACEPGDSFYVRIYCNAQTSTAQTCDLLLTNTGVTSSSVSTYTMGNGEYPILRITRLTATTYNIYLTNPTTYGISILTLGAAGGFIELNGAAPADIFPCYLTAVQESSPNGTYCKYITAAGQQLGSVPSGTLYTVFAQKPGRPVSLPVTGFDAYVA